jgi:four helix bundle protein
MGVHRFEDLIAWQLAFELEKEVYASTALRPAWSDFKFSEQIRDSSASATRNTAEGFGRFRPRDHAQFLGIAHASLDETKSGLHSAHHRGYLTTVEYRRLLRLVIRALAANAGLIKYLRGCDPNGPPFGPVSR